MKTPQVLCGDVKLISFGGLNMQRILLPLITYKRIVHVNLVLIATDFYLLLLIVPFTL